ATPVTSEPGLGDIPAHKAPAVIHPVGTKRVKPVPSFQFDKREDPDEGFPAAPPDLDDPLSSILFQDAREAVDEARPTGRRGTLNDMARDSVGKALSELEDDLVGEEAFEDPDDLDLAFHDADDDALPASLSRAAMGDTARGRSGWRPNGLTMIAGSIGVLAIAGVVGFTVFAGSSDEGDAPPIIRADARDVKVRPEDDAGQSARPDIAERADIGEDGRLVLPDEVTISTAEPASTVLDEPGLISRRVRTVVVKPDGTIVPADDSNVEAAQAVAESAAQEPAEPSPDRGFSIPSSDAPAPTPEVAVAPATPEVSDEALPQRPSDNAIAFAPSVPTPEEVDGQTETIDQLIGGVTEEAAPLPSGVPRRRPAPPPRRQQAAIAPSAATQTAAPRTTAPQTASPQAPSPQAPVDLTGPQSAAAPARQAPATRAPARSGDIQTGVLRPTSPGATQRQPTAAAAAPAPAATTSAGPWGVQLASQRTRADAQRSAAGLKSRYASILGGAEPVIMEADLGTRGRFYRVRIATSTRQEAARLCTRLKSAGADCFIGRN
ncbi:MAG: SPOR domain-containing protein, partial [Pseudomonadota bacterium]